MAGGLAEEPRVDESIILSHLLSAEIVGNARVTSCVGDFIPNRQQKPSAPKKTNACQKPRRHYPVLCKVARFRSCARKRAPSCQIFLRKITTGSQKNRQHNNGNSDEAWTRRSRSEGRGIAVASGNFTIFCQLPLLSKTLQL